MSDEHPIQIKKIKKADSENDRICVVHYLRNEETDIRPLSVECFITIQIARQVRQAHYNPVVRLDDICSTVPCEFDTETQGHHRWCYSNFTNVSKFRDASKVSSENLTDSSFTSQSTSTRTSSRCATSSQSVGPLFPTDKCIFCDKGRKNKRGIKENVSKCLTVDGKSSIKNCAHEKNDFELMGKIEGVDLRAREAMYHESCRREYVRKPRISTEPEVVEEDMTTLRDFREKRAAYENAFQFVAGYVKEKVINGGVVLRMIMLREKFLDYIQEFSPTYYNVDYQTHKLKERLVLFFGDQIQFWRPNSRSDLVFSSDLNVGEAVEVAFEAAASEKRILEDAALTLRRHIQDTHTSNSNIPWPPSASYLTNEASPPPDVLKDFLSTIVSGKSYKKTVI